MHGKLVDAANSHIAGLKDKGTQEVLRYVTVAVAAVKSKLHKDKEHLATEKQEVAAEEPAKVIAEIDVTGYPLEKVLACKTGKRKLDAALESAFKKLDFKTKDFQPKTDPVLRVVGGPRLDERNGKQFLVFHPLQLEHIIDLKGACTNLENADVSRAAADGGEAANGRGGAPRARRPRCRHMGGGVRYERRRPSACRGGGREEALVARLVAQEEVAWQHCNDTRLLRITITRT